MWSDHLLLVVALFALSAGCGRSHQEPCALRVRIDDGSRPFERCVADPDIHFEQEGPAYDCAFVYSEVVAYGDDLIVSLQLDGDAFERAGTHPARISLRGARVCGDVEWCHFYGECDLDITRAAGVGEELAARLVPCTLTEGPAGHPLPTVRALEIQGMVGLDPFTDAGLCD